MTTAQPMTTGTSIATRWSEPQLPERLAALVESPSSDEVPAITDDEARAVRHALSVYADAPKGSAVAQIDRMMTKLSLGYPSAKLSAAEADMRMELYAEQLSDLPPDILSAGFAAAIKTCKFFPSVAEIRAAALSQPAPMRMFRQHRLRKMLDAHEAAANEPAPSVPMIWTVDAVRDLGKFAKSGLANGWYDQAMYDAAFPAEVRGEVNA